MKKEIIKTSELIRYVRYFQNKSLYKIRHLWINIDERTLQIDYHIISIPDSIRHKNIKIDDIPTDAILDKIVFGAMVCNLIEVDVCTELISVYTKDLAKAQADYYERYESWKTPLNTKNIHIELS